MFYLIISIIADAAIQSKYPDEVHLREVLRYYAYLQNLLDDTRRNYITDESKGHTNSELILINVEFLQRVEADLAAAERTMSNALSEWEHADSTIRRTKKESEPMSGWASSWFNLTSVAKSPELDEAAASLRDDYSQVSATVRTQREVTAHLAGRCAALRSGIAVFLRSISR